MAAPLSVASVVSPGPSLALPPLPPSAPAVVPQMPTVSFATGALVLTWLDLVAAVCAADAVSVAVLRASQAWMVAIAQSLLLGAKVRIDALFAVLRLSRLLHALSWSAPFIAIRLLHS